MGLPNGLSLLKIQHRGIVFAGAGATRRQQ
jgi:hypothetical protein